jgi:hypothetical protein
VVVARASLPAAAQGRGLAAQSEGKPQLPRCARRCSGAPLAGGVPPRKGSPEFRCRHTPGFPYVTAWSGLVNQEVRVSFDVSMTRMPWKAR